MPLKFAASVPTRKEIEGQSECCWKYWINHDDLSEQRAQAVVEALKANGVSTSLDATGFGETRPVAPNENSDGSDNPAGRQLNRRVEIFIPVF